MGTCKYCDSVADETGLCQGCQLKLGLTSGASVRPSAPCAKCSYPQLVRALVRELTTTPGEYGSRETVPMAVTYTPKVTIGFWTGDPKGAEGVSPNSPAGILELYVCRRCGFTEWYCRAPAEIPIGPEHGTELIDAYRDGDAPYR